MEDVLNIKHSHKKKILVATVVTENVDASSKTDAVPSVEACIKKPTYL